MDLTGPLFGSGTIAFAKPDPRPFLHVRGSLDLAPARVLHIGDRYDLDVLAAETAGLLAVNGWPWQHGWQRLLAGGTGPPLTA